MDRNARLIELVFVDPAHWDLADACGEDDLELVATMTDAEIEAACTFLRDRLIRARADASSMKSE